MNLEEIIAQLNDLIVPWGMKVLGAVAILLIGRIGAGIASRVVRRALGRANVDETLAAFFCRFAYIAVIVMAVVASLAKFGIQTTSFIAILGAAGFAVGMALQGSLSNFAAGVMIVSFRPFKIGDFIDAAGVSGTVKAIHLFTTEVATPDNVKVIVPNSSIFGGTIKNFSVYDTRRLDLEIGIGYSSSIERAIEVLEEIIRGDNRVFRDPDPQVMVKELADSSVNLLVRCWTKRTDFWNVRCDLTRRIKEHFDIQGIDIPFPQIVVHKESE